MRQFESGDRTFCVNYVLFFRTFLLWNGMEWNEVIWMSVFTTLEEASAAMLSCVRMCGTEYVQS